MIKHSGKVNNYRTDEGKTILVPYKGDVKDTINDIFGSLRSTCTYINASGVSEIYENSTFIVV
jgi:GMP reductase